jgi:methionyl aminopeptidase
MNYNVGGFFTLKDSTWLERQRYAGKVLASTLSLVRRNVKSGISTACLDEICEKNIISNKCHPTFKNYINFPAATCISVNEELVHGIPKKDVILKKGDIVKIDSGATFEGAIADSALTVVVDDYNNSKDKELVEACKKCLYKAIELVENNIGKITTGDLGFFIKKEVSKIGANAIRELTGHGLEYNKPHFYPPITNYGNKKEGQLIVPNMTFCIEPIFVFGSSNIFTKSDKFTIAANYIGAHWEHTIFVHEDKVEIITKREDDEEN